MVSVLEGNHSTQSSDDMVEGTPGHNSYWRASKTTLAPTTTISSLPDLSTPKPLVFPLPDQTRNLDFSFI